MRVDSKVCELAALFLGDHFEPDDERTLALAESLQFSIEEWIDAEKARIGAEEYPDPRTDEDWKRHAE